MPFTPSFVPPDGLAAIRTARRVLVTGLVDAPAEVAIAACDLAESLGAAIDPGSPETARTIGPVMARIGRVTADHDELARADLVVYWFCLPDAPAAARSTIVIMPDNAVSTDPRQRRVVIPREAAGRLARATEAILRTLPIDAAACEDHVVRVAHDIASAISAARCLAVVTDGTDDLHGLDAWSIASLVRTVAHRMPAFELPRGERHDAAVAVCTWRYGAAGSIACADRAGGRFLPAECDAVRLIARGEVDGVVVVGHATPAVATAIDSAGERLQVVRLPADAAAIRGYTDALPRSGTPA